MKEFFFSLRGFRGLVSVYSFSVFLKMTFMLSGINFVSALLTLSSMDFVLTIKYLTIAESSVICNFTKSDFEKFFFE